VCILLVCLSVSRILTLVLVVLILLTLQPNKGLVVLYHIVPHFSVFDALPSISQFQLLKIIYFFISPCIILSSFGS